MFGFANGLLAFLALAAVLDFLPVLRHRRALVAWWGEERLLFTTRYASVRQKYGAWAFLMGVMVYEFIVVFNNSMARENWPWLQTRVSPVLDWVMYLCFGFKILLGTKYNGRSMVCAGLLYFVAPAVRTIAGYKPAMQVRFGLIPAVGYLFDYLTRIYTDLLAQGTPAAVEFMPFVCCVAYLAFVLRSSAENETRLRLEQTQENLHLQVTQATREIASLRESERRASTYRHDLRHHMQYLAGCIENGRTEQAQAYIREVCAEIESQKVRVFCENETVNLILSAFAGRAEESGVPLRVRAEVPHFIPVAETDLCVLLSNALENALHACQRLRQTGEPCDIELVVYEKSGKFFLQVTNTCPPGVTFEKGLPVTREPGHGIGVRSICSIAERYNGMYSFSEKDGRFVLRVSL